jgi:hypothetical protein
LAVAVQEALEKDTRQGENEQGNYEQKQYKQGSMFTLGTNFRKDGV